LMLNQEKGYFLSETPTEASAYSNIRPLTHNRPSTLNVYATLMRRVLKTSEQALLF